MTSAKTLQEPSAAVGVRRSPLRVGAVDDPAEVEAEALADRVMRMPLPGSAVIRRCPGGCPDEEEIRRQPAGGVDVEEEDEEGTLVGRKAVRVGDRRGRVAVVSRLMVGLGGRTTVASEFTRRPKLLKGAIVAYQSQLIPGVPRVVVFQYNPDTLTRTLKHRTASAAAAEGGTAPASDVLKVTGPPQESISMKVTLDAADQLESPGENPDVVAAGLHPALATLELLLYPTSKQVLANLIRGEVGHRSVTPMDVPLSLLVWGPARVVPVRVTSFSVTEQAFDPMLNPTRAEVSIDLEVLSYHDLERGTLGHGASLVNHVAKEALSVVHQVKTAGEAVGRLPF